MKIPAGTTAKTAAGTPLEKIGLQSVVDPPATPGAHIIGFAYDFTPNGATFSPPITLTLEYDPDSLPEGVAEEDLVVAYYDIETGTWIELAGVVDPVSNTITVQVSHFTMFAVLAPTPAPTPVVTPTKVPTPVTPLTPVPTLTPTPEEAPPFNAWVAIGPILGILALAALIIYLWMSRRQTKTFS